MDWAYIYIKKEGKYKYIRTEQINNFDADTYDPRDGAKVQYEYESSDKKTKKIQVLRIAGTQNIFFSLLFELSSKKIFNFTGIYWENQRKGINEEGESA